MMLERKSTMVSARVPKDLVSRVDFVARNIDSDVIKNRSAAVQAALEAWLPGQEDRLRDLGILPKKIR
jgi:Arc/MetJ-type ribon-helix-helix transcriptional regulator